MPEFCSVGRMQKAGLLLAKSRPKAVTHRCSEDTKEGDKFAGDEGTVLRLCGLLETFPIRFRNFWVKVAPPTAIGWLVYS